MKRTILTTLCAFLFALALSADTAQNISLNGVWKLSYWKQPDSAITSPEGMSHVEIKEIPAQVPGNVELDLLSAGLIKDPMIGSNVNLLRPWEGFQWCYTKEFEAPKLADGQHCVIHFGGIDCLADIWLNNHHVGSAEDMLIEHDFDITNLLKQGSNTVQVILRSAVMEAQKYNLSPLSIGNFASDESVHIRKAPHMYGWDIMPRLVSAGLWRKVELHIQNPTHISDVHYTVTSVDTPSRDVWVVADMQFKMPFDKFGKVKAVTSLTRKGKEVYHNERVLESLGYRQFMHVPNADLWWPKGYGEAALYEAQISLVDADGKVLSTDHQRIGLRTVQLDHNDINLPDNPGKFRFIVNGEPIYVRGTNWVPLDGLHSRDHLWVDSTIAMTADLNCNMIRCWGGNVYEDQHFFDLCDENGIMIWQDFAMACSFYPQGQEFADKITKEITSVVCKLRNHPCIALWSGNNEDDGALRMHHSDPNNDRISRDVIPRVLYEYDPTRPYLPSSPYYSTAVCQHNWDENCLPEDHLWGPRGYYKDAFYAGSKACFVSEIGYHGCPNEESLKKMMTKDCVYPWTHNFDWNDEWVTKSVRRFASEGATYDRNNLMINQIKFLFGDVPTRLEDFIFASQSVQAEAMKYFVEMWRGKKFENRTGMIWWNVRDGWPIISDAIVDYYFSKKRAYYFIRNAQRDVCVLMNDAENGSFPLMAVNDTRAEASGKVTVTNMADGKKVFEGSFQIPANGKVKVTSIPDNGGQGIYLISYQVAGKQFQNHYLYGKPPFKLNVYRSLIKKTKLYSD